jgi:2-deoxy-D-gluconate 3-dehydrogenase
LILDQFKLDERIALVTGASTGLGAAIAIALAEAGAHVSCHGHTRSPAATCDRITSGGGVAHAITGDLSKPETAKDLITQTLDRFGRIDILINNAGTIRRAPAVDYSDDDWTAVIEVNLSSVFRLSKLAGKQMIDNGRGGKIVNIASLLSFQGGITVPAYAASKGGVAQLTKALANEWAKHRINVNAIAPATCARPTRQRCKPTKHATVKSSSASRPVAGANPKTLPAQQSFFLRARVIT